MFYKYTLNKDGSIKEEHLEEYDGELNKVVGNVMVSDSQHFEEEVRLQFELFKED